MRLIFIYFLALYSTVSWSQIDPVELWHSTEYVKFANPLSPKIRFDKFGNLYTSMGTSLLPFHGGRLIKYDTLGNVLWRFDAPSLYVNSIGSLSVDSLGYAYVGVQYWEPIGALDDHNTKVYKLSPMGEVIWEKKMINENYEKEGIGFGELDTLHGRLIIAGSHTRDTIVEDNYYYIQAMDTTNGAIIWRTEILDIPWFLYNGKLLEDRIILFFVRVKEDGIYYVVAQIDYNGNILAEYEHKYSTVPFQYNDISYITKNGDILLGNRGTGYNVAKLNLQGDTLWIYSMNTPLVQNIGAVFDLCEDEFQNVYCTGSSVMENDTATDYITTKFDSNGNVLWQYVYQLEPQSFDYWDGGYEIASSRNFIVTLGKPTLVTDEGNLQYPPIMHIHSPNWSEPLFTIILDSISATTRNALIVGDKVYYQMLNTIPNTNQVNEVTGCIALPQTSSTHSTISTEGILTFPNPTHGQITFSKLEPGLFEELCIVDVKGQVLDCMDVNNQEEISFSLGKYPAGTYLVLLKGKKGTLHKKVVKL